MHLDDRRAGGGDVHHSALDAEGQHAKSLNHSGGQQAADSGLGLGDRQVCQGRLFAQADRLRQVPFAQAAAAHQPGGKP